MAKQSPRPLGGVIHSYQRYDPKNIPSPLAEAPDVLSRAFDHMLVYGSLRELSEEELARAVKLDPSQIAGLGPSLDSLIARLLERRRRILEKYETDRVQKAAAERYWDFGRTVKPPEPLKQAFLSAFREEQLFQLERLWYRSGDDRSKLARQLVQLVHRLGEKYQVDELAAKYPFTGRTELTIPMALEVKEELEMIDRLLKQLEEAKETAQIGIIDLEELAELTDPEDVQGLAELARQVEEYIRELADRQGLERNGRGFNLTPKAYRLFQGRLLERIFSQLDASRSGRHQGPVVGEGAVELQQTRPYEFGDSVANIDAVGSLENALIRNGPGLPVRMNSDDILIHRTRNTPKCATVVLLDMSGSMRYDGLYVDVKRMGLALEGLIRREYPGDYLQFIEMATFAKPRHASEIASLMPKPVTLHDPVIQLRADMSNERLSEQDVPPHFTNIQHGLQLARRFLAAQDTPNRQVILITDGLPTAHFEAESLYLLYPPHRRTEEATMREGQFCCREQITINIFLLPTWSQSSEDVRFAYRLAESTSGRVFFTAGKDLDRYVVWDYRSRRRELIG
ncbi:MAG: vWA domain-containing protein [Thermoguttaceae bacterium]